MVVYFPDTAEVRQHLEELGKKYSVNEDDDEILEVFYEGIAYDPEAEGDPIDQLCSHYGVNRSLVENVGYAQFDD